MINQAVIVGELLEHDPKKQTVKIRSMGHVIQCTYGEGLGQHLPKEGEVIGIKGVITEDDNKVFIQKLTYFELKGEDNGEKKIS